MEVCGLLGIDRRTLRRWTASGYFPPPIRLSRRANRWRRNTVEAFLAKLEANASKDPL
jgi:predicted DNA-binding transcriptional regulator AlpA